MNHEEVKRRLLKDPEVREAYENPPLPLATARTVVERRKELGMTQVELAKRMGSSQSQVWRIESGQFNPTLKTLSKLERALGISLVPTEMGSEETAKTLPHQEDEGGDEAVYVAMLGGQVADEALLKEGWKPVLRADSIGDFGDLLMKARLLRGWSYADMAQALDTKPQQIQSYERCDWQQASLLCIQEAAEALDLDVTIHARLAVDEDGLSKETVTRSFENNAIDIWTAEDWFLQDQSVFDAVRVASEVARSMPPRAIGDAFTSKVFHHSSKPVRAMHFHYSPSEHHEDIAGLICDVEREREAV